MLQEISQPDSRQHLCRSGCWAETAAPQPPPVDQLRPLLNSVGLGTSAWAAPTRDAKHRLLWEKTPQRICTRCRNKSEVLLRRENQGWTCFLSRRVSKKWRCTWDESRARLLPLRRASPKRLYVKGYCTIWHAFEVPQVRVLRASGKKRKVFRGTNYYFLSF